MNVAPGVGDGVAVAGGVRTRVCCTVGVAVTVGVGANVGSGVGVLVGSGVGVNVGAAVGVGVVQAVDVAVASAVVASSRFTAGGTRRRVAADRFPSACGASRPAPLETVTPL